jgi:uncharacterized protein YyaL (SSP411 family)
VTHTNRLIDEKSPYLQQHAHNPVDWYPWGEEAFAVARRENRPVFLSIGYSTCHWCHVMERESFEDEATARLLNDHFIAIKVDREERPEVDQVYMEAVQAITGRGGWPMSVFLLSDGRPFYGGTYFPPQQFAPLLERISTMHRRQRPQLEKAAGETVEAVRHQAATLSREARQDLDQEVVTRAVTALRRSFDEVHGGFGGAPKFPPYNGLTLLLWEHGRTGDHELLRLVTVTLEGMARGGIHDHIGGGFHRYSTDPRWFLPHFEKMLYDNALLSRSYVEAYVVTGDPVYREVAMDVYHWVTREMTSPEGGFHSALDADSEGVEGRYYLWRREEIEQVLGADEAELFCWVYGVERDGNYREEALGRASGENVVFLRQRVTDLAARRSIDSADLEGRMADARRKLLAVRDRRPRPSLDDKILASWNGLMIASLAYAGRVLDEPQLSTAAARAAGFVLTSLVRDGRLFRRWRDGEARFAACLDDYVYLAYGLLELHAATHESAWLGEARQLMEAAIREFWDGDQGGFFYTANGAEPLFVRPKDALDHPLPSSNGLAVIVLLELADRTGDERDSHYAGETLRAMASWMERAPYGTETLALATARHLARAEAPVPISEAAISAKASAKPETATATRNPVTFSVTPSAATVAPGGKLTLSMRLSIEKDWHINSHTPYQDYLIPTSVTVAGTAPLTVATISYPAGRDLEVAGEILSVYEGTLELAVPISLAKAAKRGRIELRVDLRFQACDGTSCLVPDEITTRVPVTVASINPP